MYLDKLTITREKAEGIYKVVAELGNIDTDWSWATPVEEAVKNLSDGGVAKDFDRVQIGFASVEGEEPSDWITGTLQVQGTRDGKIVMIAAKVTCQVDGNEYIAFSHAFNARRGIVVRALQPDLYSDSNVRRIRSGGDAD